MAASVGGDPVVVAVVPRASDVGVDLSAKSMAEIALAAAETDGAG